jgi:hypothetical protein
MKHAPGCRCNVCRASCELQTRLETHENIELQRASNDNAADVVKIALPTASKTDRFLGCQWWVGKPITDSNVGHGALYGSAFHEVMAGVEPKQACAKFGIEEVDDIIARAKAATDILKTWLRGGNPWQLRFDTWRISKEISISYNIETATARACAPPTVDAHEYADREDDEIPGTVDLLGIGCASTKFAHLKKPTPKVDAVLIGDHKSGYDIGSPHESGQLLTLALAACRLYKVDKAYIFFLHAPGHMEPTIYADVVDADGLQAHADALQAANAKINDGTLRPDYYCKWCQAFSVCPSNAGALVELRGKRTLVTAEDVGAAHLRLQEARKRFEGLSSQIDNEIRVWIAKNGSAVRPDGREVGFVDRPFTNLSQASIIRALGEIKGRREIERLKKLGCIESGERPELRVKS